MNQLDRLKVMVDEFREARDWRKFHNPKDLALSVVLEATELLELFQWKDQESVKSYIDEGGTEEVRKEMADVMIYLLMMASDLKIDLESAVVDKVREQEKKYPVEKAKGVATKYTKL